MRAYLLHIVLSLLALGLCIVLFALFNYANVPAFKSVVREYSSNISIPKVISNTWRDKLSKMVMKDYSPAVSQYYLKFDIIEITEPKKLPSFTLEIADTSFYSRFCLIQTLENFKVQYKLLQSKAKTQIRLDTDNKKLLANIIDKLKEYNIKTKLIAA